MQHGGFARDSAPIRRDAPAFKSGAGARLLSSLLFQEGCMTKNELIAAIADETGKTKADVSAILGSLAGVVAKTLKSGGDVTLGGIGKLAAAKREAREARNPSTGATIKVPAKTVVKFKVTKDLADAVA
ncbi:HU family DNA-binding protein [Bosea rubneri]|nr:MULTISPECIES: HU family DNA-binding protein [unclassified Bosea (in: a-proteobacteria)]MDU0343524.1 HU family DNA-binding protein [Bosea sp. ZW T0_25]